MQCKTAYANLCYAKNISHCLNFFSIESCAGGAAEIDALVAKLRALDLSQRTLPQDTEFHYYKTDSREWLIGFEQIMVIHASVGRVAAAIDDMKAYVGMFTDLVRVEYTMFKNRDDFTVLSETHVGIPFIPNDRTEMNYHVNRSGGKALFRYSLKTGNNMKYYEGFQYLAPLANGDSLFYEYDSFEPELGLAKIVGREKIWREGATSNMQSDWALKFRSEHPDWPADKILDESENKAEEGRERVRKLFEERQMFSVQNVGRSLVLLSEGQKPKKAAAANP